MASVNKVILIGNLGKDPEVRTTPQGTSLAATQSILDRIARDVREKMPGLRNTVVNAGGFGGSSGGNGGSVSVLRSRRIE